MGMELMRGIPGAEKVHIQIGAQRLECRVVADRWWHDSLLVQAATTYDFFQTTALKTPAMAKFEGDRSLVKEREYALIYGAVYYLLDPSWEVIPPTVDALKLRNASYEWKQSDVTVSEDNLLALEGGSSYRISGGAAIAAEAQPGDGRHDNMRRFAKPILVLGGRSVDFSVTLGTVLATESKLMIRFYGLHLIPTKKLAAPTVRAVARSIRR